jgi:hypothetical protein
MGKLESSILVVSNSLRLVHEAVAILIKYLQEDFDGEVVDEVVDCHGSGK